MPATAPVRAPLRAAGLASNCTSAATSSSATPRISGSVSVPIADQMPESVLVAWLKWDATPRRRCIVISTTSKSELKTASPAGTRTHQHAGSCRTIHTTVHTKTPKDNPNATGLRHDTGPHHGPPSTRRHHTVERARGHHALPVPPPRVLAGQVLPAKQLAEMKKTVPAEAVGGRYGLGLIESELSCGIRIWGHSGGIHGSNSVAFTTTNGRHSLALNLNGDWAGDPEKIIAAEYRGT
ncbi:hypothetical protein [Streptomyces sp. NPDC048825]|uniref:hypothetical protein n=1 Tax=Streptomyces sp. NPDC048825 TaxID=3365592 RepID=UPI0037125E5C